MKITFQTKEESKKQQQEEFLKLSGGERVWRFFNLCYEFSKFPTKHKKDTSSNFEIVIPLKKQ